MLPDELAIQGPKSLAFGREFPRSGNRAGDKETREGSSREVWSIDACPLIPGPSPARGEGGNCLFSGGAQGIRRGGNLGLRGGTALRFVRGGHRRRREAARTFGGGGRCRRRRCGGRGRAAAALQAGVDQRRLSRPC